MATNLVKNSRFTCARAESDGIPYVRRGGGLIECSMEDMRLPRISGITATRHLISSSSCLRVLLCNVSAGLAIIQKIGS